MDRSHFFRKTQFAWRLALLPALALLLLPSFNADNVMAGRESDQNRRIRELLRDSSVEVRDIKGQVVAELKDGVSRQVQPENFENQIKDIGTALRDGQLGLRGVHYNLIWNLQDELSSTPANDTSHNSLRGAGGNADALANWLFFTSPLDDDKFLRDLALKVKFRVEYQLFSGEKPKFAFSNAHITMTTNPRLRNKLLYTKGIYDVYGSPYGPSPEGMTGGEYGGGGGKVRIDMALGGSSTDPRSGEFMGLACIFGTAAPNAMVNVMAFGVTGTFDQTVWADSLGNWRADFNELGSGHSLFGAVNGLGVPYTMVENLVGGCDYEVCEATMGLNGCDCVPMMGKAAKIELGLLRDVVRFDRD